MASAFKFNWNDKSGLVKPPSNYNLFCQAKKRRELPWVNLDWSRLPLDDSKYWADVGTGLSRAFDQAKIAAMKQGLNHATVHWQVPVYPGASAAQQQLSTSSTISSNPEPSLGESQPRPAQGRGANHYRERPIIPLPKRKPRLTKPQPSLPASSSTPHPDVAFSQTPQKSRQAQLQRKKPLSPHAQPQFSAQTLPPSPPYCSDRKPSPIYAEWRREHGTASDPPHLYYPSKAYNAWYERVCKAELPGANDENVFVTDSNLNDEDEDRKPLVKKEELGEEEKERLRMERLLATWDPNIDPALIAFS